ncbi:phytoene desaturase family protein [Hyphococcus luteus]|uniref:Pyridine nucleotide-disulfide oxidoreductase domain-containing protein 2 n=1 Tax=Hyphococcus luteus TaxID=2058213 RepID=A0A2S7KA09_9PROT|nr:NAD(P)/FAD-dependent oxidoreductase [Marinicaulis flavus]PQA89335.1 FAD-dependent oxidoreductase [Marinicaulis flavus]
MSRHYDAIIIGGGHNGLVCGFYLAKAGRRVLILEKRDIVGGAAVTEEFHPGFRNSVASYSVSLLNPKIIADMELARHRLKVLIRPADYFAPSPDGKHLFMTRDERENIETIRKLSPKDAKAYPLYHERLDKLVDLFRSTLLETPPNAGGGVRDMFSAAMLAKRAHKLGLEGQRDLIDLFGKSAGDILDNWFELDSIKGILGFDAITGAYCSPYTPGSAYVLLHHVFGEANGIQGAWGHAVGGMGAITQAMAAAVKDAGGEIRTDAPVREVIIENDRAQGVVLDDGTPIRARVVASNIHPQLLYGKLIPESALPEEFAERIGHWRSGSGVFRMNVALSELPNFTARPSSGVELHHQASIMIAPSLEYLDTAYTDARRTGWAKKPVIEMHIPSTIDNSLAPEGQHVASLFCQQFAPELPNGESWEDHRDDVADLIIDTVNDYAPNFKASVIGRMALSPLDLERKLSLVGGDIFHGQLGLDQLFSARPVLGYADYRGPFKGLYMCGSSTHPGGGVTGLPGHNAAREILRDIGKGRGGQMRAAAL